MRRPLSRPLAAALATGCLAVAAAGCGGGDDPADVPPKTLLGEAASKQIESAEVRLRTDADVPGFPILGSRIAIDGGGPFVANGPEALPEFDWRVRMRAGGQTFPARVSGIDGKVYVEFMGQFYEADKELVDGLELKSGEAKRKAVSLSELGLDPDKWLKRVKVSDGEEIGGDSTRLVTGTVVKKAVVENLLEVSDLDRLAEAAGGLGNLDGDIPELDEDNAGKLAEAVDAAKVEVNVDDEGYPRRVYAKLRFTMPDDVKDTAIEKGTIVYELVLEQIGGVTVDVEPPFEPDPLSDLFDFAGAVFGIDEPSDLWRKPN